MFRLFRLAARNLKRNWFRTTFTAKAAWQDAEIYLRRLYMDSKAGVSM